jgi:hypothetical protein
LRSDGAFGDSVIVVIVGAVVVVDEVAAVDEVAGASVVATAVVVVSVASSPPHAAASRARAIRSAGRVRVLTSTGV